MPRKFLKIDTLLKKKTIIDKPSDKQSSKTPDSTSMEKVDKEHGDNQGMEGYGTEEEMEVEGEGDSHVEGKDVINEASGIPDLFV